jgi:PAS domain-containing protein
MTEVPSPLLDLIGQVYDAALDESLWAGLAEPITATFGSPSANVFTTSPASIVMLTRTANVDAVAKEYEAYYYQRDLWVQRVLGHRLGTVVDSGDLIADVELENSEFYCDYLRRADMFYVLGSVFPVSNGEIGALGIHRPRGASSYERSDKVLVSTFLPHLRRALQIRQRLVRPPIGLQADLAALDRSQLATAVVARDGRILYANPIAERLLRLQDGIMTVGGRIATRGRQAQDRLSALVHDAVDSASGKPGHGGGSMAIDREDRAPQMMSASYRAEITEKLIREEVHGETHEAEDRDEAGALLTVSEPRTS